jgi:hypothetical protein
VHFHLASVLQVWMRVYVRLRCGLGVRITSTYPPFNSHTEINRMRLHPVFFVSFDQLIEPEKVLKVMKCNLADSKKEYAPLTLVSPKDISQYPGTNPKLFKIALKLY